MSYDSVKLIELGVTSWFLITMLALLTEPIPGLGKLALYLGYRAESSRW